MTLSLTELQRLAGTTRFRADTLEKVLLLLDLLDARAHPYSGSRVGLKGGTALNPFTLDVPRLSVDIDLNDVGAVDRARMKTERPDVERGLSRPKRRASGLRSVGSHRVHSTRTVTPGDASFTNGRRASNVRSPGDHLPADGVGVGRGRVRLAVHPSDDLARGGGDDRLRREGGVLGRGLRVAEDAQPVGG